MSDARTHTGRTGSELVERFLGFMAGNGPGQRHDEHHGDLGDNLQMFAPNYIMSKAVVGVLGARGQRLRHKRLPPDVYSAVNGTFLQQREVTGAAADRCVLFCVTVHTKFHRGGRLIYNSVIPRSLCVTGGTSEGGVLVMPLVRKPNILG